jgi:hypothetical protein
MLPQQQLVTLTARQPECPPPSAPHQEHDLRPPQLLARCPGPWVQPDDDGRAQHTDHRQECAVDEPAAQHSTTQHSTMELCGCTSIWSLPQQRCATHTCKGVCVGGPSGLLLHQYLPRSVAPTQCETVGETQSPSSPQSLGVTVSNCHPSPSPSPLPTPRPPCAIVHTPEEEIGAAEPVH